MKKLLILLFMLGVFNSCEEYPPIVTAIKRGAYPGSQTTNADRVEFDVTFSEEVVGVSLDDFNVTSISGEFSGDITSIISNDSTTFTVSVDIDHGDGAIRLDLFDHDQSILDQQGEPLYSPTYVTGEAYILTGNDTEPPSVIAINRGSVPASNPTNASSVSFLVTFSSIVNTVVAGDFCLTNTGLGSPSISGVIGVGTTRTVTVDVSGVEGDVGLDLCDFDSSIVDEFSNSLSPNTHVSDQLWSVDAVGPKIINIRRANANPTNSTYLEWEVTFDDDIASGSVFSGDFSFSVISGSFSTMEINELNIVGKTIVVGVSVKGSGEIRLDLDDRDQTITDIFGNSSRSLTHVGDETYWVKQ